MKITANNKEYNFTTENSPNNLADFLEANDFDCKKVLIAVNNKIIKVTDFTETLLKDNDIIDIMSFVGGG